jgi:uncharacterized damage-inducible protein DinB
MAIRGFDRETLHRAESPGRWSPAQVIRHLADVELVYAVRIRLAAAESDPVLPGFAQNDWVARLGEVDADESLSILGMLRRTTIRLVRGLGSEALARSGRHPEFGRMTVDEMLKRMSSHDTRHLAQIARTLKLTAPGIDPDALRHEGMVAHRPRSLEAGERAREGDGGRDAGG